MFRKLLILIALGLSTPLFSQTIDEVKTRMQAINNPNGVTFYNMDGYRITSEEINKPFTEKGMRKSLRQYNLGDLKGKKDEQLGLNNLYFSMSDKVTETCSVTTSYYFIENSGGTISFITFSAANKHDQDFDRNIAKLIMNKQIPSECFEPMEIRGSINFAGRKLELNSNCYWTSINTVQCPYDGEMNWSMHKDAADAKLAIDSQMEITKAHDVEVISQSTIDVIFEDVPTTAVKVVYDLKGIASVAGGMSGGKTLTAYYIAEAVRGNYISCVMSHWNNDDIQNGGLPILLSRVMKLK
ncbi:MAG: hypothetical protein EOO48_03765 [Flavobacterium sp.]|nr:MAG: hypothetical protein EOO48_03765 [Flavobacterium sp.]